MTSGGRYFRNAKGYKKDAFAVLRSKFVNRKAFEHFYEAIPNPVRKNEFLRICCSYRYLAKDGKWRVYVRGVNRDIDYLDNSFKLVAILMAECTARGRSLSHQHQGSVAEAIRGIQGYLWFDPQVC